MADAWLDEIFEKADPKAMLDALGPEHQPGSPEWTYDDERGALDRLALIVGDWQGIPTSLPDQPLVLHDRHPLAPVYAEIDAKRRAAEREAAGVSESFTCSSAAMNKVIVNEWFCRQRNVEVTIYRDTETGERGHICRPRSPDQSMNRLLYWLQTIGASDAWDEAAEYKARDKLRGLLTERQWRHYDLTGAFFETSERSRLTYVFRRLRPTVALSPRWFNPKIDEMRCLAVLCLHPIGYYSASWGGAMVPSDDVIAHLLAMRSDEAYFWRKANQHEAWKPEAGL